MRRSPVRPSPSPCLSFIDGEKTTDAGLEQAWRQPGRASAAPLPMLEISCHTIAMTNGARHSTRWLSLGTAYEENGALDSVNFVHFAVNFERVADCRETSREAIPREMR